MDISNLHSLFSGKWFIEESYGKSLLPSLSVILNGTPLKTKSASYAAEDCNVMRNHVSGYAFGESTNENDYVVVMNIKSPIYKYNQECGPSGTKSKIQRLEQYKSDVNCVGVVLDIDSGGGQVSGTPEFHDYLKSYSKPIVTYTDGLLCSAAYYIASGSDAIIANKRADHIGSIGTMIHFVDLTGYYEKQGAKVITEYATKSTEKNRAFEELVQGNPEKYIKTELDPINEDFHADIKAARPNVDASVFTGATYNANDSLENNLIDSIGTLQDAIDKVFELSQTSNSNSNTNMSKKRPLVEAVLGLDEPLASNDNGVYLNDEQVDAIEQNIEAQNTAVADLTTQLEAAQDNTELNAQLTTATDSLTAVESNVDEMLTEAGLTVEGTLTEKLTALSTKVSEMSKADGAAHTRPKVEGKETPKGNIELDASASHNALADQIHN